MNTKISLTEGKFNFVTNTNKNVENPNKNMWKSVKQKGSWPAIDVIY